MRTARTSLLVPLGTGALLLLTACTGGGDAPAPDAPGTSAPGSTPEPGEETPAPAASGADCLLGEWEMDLEASSRSLAETLGEEAAAEMELAVDGDGVLVFDGSTMTSRYTDQTTTVTMSLELVEGSPALEMVSTTTIDGEIVADYTATGTELTTSDVDASGLTLENSTTMDGEEVDVPGLDSFQDAGVLEADGTLAYECSETELRLTPQVEGTDDVPTQVLTRLG